MTTEESELLGAFEAHSAARIRAVLDAGFDVRSPINGKSPVNSLIEMYTKSDRFPECLALLLERGAELDDPRLAPVLLDDADGLRDALRADPSLIAHRTSMVCAFTPLIGASLLHVAAEYGHGRAARVLLEMGADVNATASIDARGLNGQTPLFHTVNSNESRSTSVLEILLDAGAKPDVRLHGITWGKGFDWETTCFDVTPVSYAQLGLLPQMHRRERDVYDTIERLLRASGRIVPQRVNVPNRYLRTKP